MFAFELEQPAFGFGNRGRRCRAGIRFVTGEEGDGKEEMCVQRFGGVDVVGDDVAGGLEEV